LKIFPQSANFPAGDLLMPQPGEHPKEEMARRIAAFDWPVTPLGARDQWPQSLRTAVNILLSSRYQMWMAWGETLTFLYNDAYRPTLGIKHPWALGRPASEVWAEIWEDIGPRIDSVLTTGKATYDEGLLLFLERSGFTEETYHTFSYSPLLDDSGRISGMLCVVTEETGRVIGERQVETLREVASGLTSAIQENDVFDELQRVLERNRQDLPFTLVYAFDQSTPEHLLEHAPAARLVGRSGIASEDPLAPAQIEAGADRPWPAGRMWHHPAQILQQLSQHRAWAAPPAGDWLKTLKEAFIVPIRQQGQDRPAGFFVAGINPYRRFDTGYSGFVNLLSGQIAAGMGNARAWAAERRRAEALAELDRAKTTFFSNVSHELRTPLTLMLSPVEELLAKARPDGDSGQRDLLELVHRNGLRLQKLVNSLLDFARIEAGRMQTSLEAVDIAAFTADLAANFRSAMDRAGLEFTIDCGESAGLAWVDREMWEKIVLNLLSNALKFTLHGAVRVSVRDRGATVELEVADTGIGIGAGDLPRVFERFHRVEGARGRTIEGTGIGLALVNELVKLHGGTVTVRSEVDRGAAFLVSIPRGAGPVAQVTARLTAIRRNAAEPFMQEGLRWLAPDSGSSVLDAREEAAEARGALQSDDRVLLVEDNADMREYLARLLGKRYRVVPAGSGEEALQVAMADPPDLVLSDVMMPGMGGFGLLAELRKHARTRTVPVILLSARAGEESRVEGLDAGADDYLIKPFTAKELLARVGAHLAMRKRREEGDRAIRESQTTLQSFYDSSPFLMGVCEIDGEEIVAIHVNQAAENFMGAEAGTARVERKWLEHFRRSQKEGAAIRFEHEHAGDAAVCWLNAAVNYLGSGPSGRPRFSFVAEDVTEKRRAEELLRRSNQELRRANEDLEQFAYSASHDLQEPLRQVAVYSQLLERKFESVLDPKAREYLDWCVEGAHRMEMLIRDLLAYSQAGKTALDSSQPVDVDGVLETVRENLATAIEESGAVLEIAPLPKLYIHPTPLTHVFQNLISNAIKYRGEQSPRISIGASADGSWWRFEVKDNGIGIPPEFCGQIFGLFKRLHNREAYPGTGIGLAICQRVVERYGGRIWVESTSGQGATFFFTMPKEQIA
jgi:signal transduction histidine kinase